MEQKRRTYDKTARQLSGIAILFNFLGIAVLMFAIFQWISSLGFAVLGMGPIIVLTYIGTPLLNFFIKLMIPALIQGNIRPEKKHRVSFAFMIIGIATTLPLVLGGLEVIFFIYAMFGILPFLPHIIGGIFFISAGFCLTRWKVEPITQTVLEAPVDVASRSTTGKIKNCPQCGGGLFGDETYCPYCAALLKGD